MNNPFLYMFGSSSAAGLVVSPHTSSDPTLTLIGASLLVASAFLLARFIIKKIL